VRHTEKLPGGYVQGRFREACSCRITPVTSPSRQLVRERLTLRNGAKGPRSPLVGNVCGPFRTRGGRVGSGRGDTALAA
jgi:hypothetical protein